MDRGSLPGAWYFSASAGLGGIILQKRSGSLVIMHCKVAVITVVVVHFSLASFSILCHFTSFTQYPIQIFKSWSTKNVVDQIRLLALEVAWSRSECSRPSLKIHIFSRWWYVHWATLRSPQSVLQGDFPQLTADETQVAMKGIWLRLWQMSWLLHLLWHAVDP